jgi:hypothetical protein
MNYMVEDEFLLLMCHNFTRGSDDNHPYHFPGKPEYVLTVQDRKRLFDVGIRTAHEQPAWQTIEPSKGGYNFDYLDGMINTNREAGLKTLFQFSGWRVPYWMPNEWRARRKDGVYEIDMLSMWNEEAQQHSDNVYRLLDEHYWEDKDVAFFLGEWQGGEGALPPTECLYDEAALEDYRNKYGTSAVPDLTTPETTKWAGDKVIEHFLRKATILYPKFHEIWNEQQHLMDTWNKSFINYVQPDILRTYRESFPEACIVLFQATYYDSSHKEDNVVFVDQMRFTYNCETIVEAMYCKGLPTTTPKAIAQKFRGQVVRPAFEDGATSLEDWMVNNIRDSNNLWRASKGL